MAEDTGSKNPMGSAPKLPQLTEIGKEDLTSEDLDDIQRLLDQKQDVTRQDITAQDFQSILSRYTKP